MAAINWIVAHWAEIGSAIALIIAAARIIVKLTPTDKDDKVLLKIKSFLKLVGLHVSDEE